MLIWWLFSSGIIWPLLTAIIIIVVVFFLWPIFSDKENIVQSFSGNEKILLNPNNQHINSVFLFSEKSIQFS